MRKIRVEQIQGDLAKPAIDEFYKRSGSKGTARKDDLFFVAYSDNQIVGCVRFCVEENTPMLRTMYVDSAHRRTGIGRLLLRVFERHLDQNHISHVYCLPYSHLEKFYGTIGFETIEASDVPKFLVERARIYAENGSHTLFMRRK